MPYRQRQHPLSYRGVALANQSNTKRHILYLLILLVTLGVLGIIKSFHTVVQFSIGSKAFDASKVLVPTDAHFSKVASVKQEQKHEEAPTIAENFQLKREAPVPVLVEKRDNAQMQEVLVVGDVNAIENQTVTNEEPTAKPILKPIQKYNVKKIRGFNYNKAKLVRKSPIVLVTFLFGEKAANSPHLPFFLRSAKHSTADVVIIGEKPNFQLPQNGKVQHFSITWNQVKQLVQNEVFPDRRLMRLWDASPYKVIDFKPLIGHLFPNIVNGYRFWGYIDNDLILGDIWGNINKVLLNMVDVVSTDRYRTAGPITIFRNSEKMNKLFFRAPDLLKVLDNEEPVNFDEWGNSFGFGEEHSMSGIIAKWNREKPKKEKIRVLKFQHESLWDGICNSNHWHVAKKGRYSEDAGLPCTCVWKLDQRVNPPVGKTYFVIETKPIGREPTYSGDRTIYEVSKLSEATMCHFEYGKAAANVKLQMMPKWEFNRLKEDTRNEFFWSRYGGISKGPNTNLIPPSLGYPKVLLVAFAYYPFSDSHLEAITTMMDTVEGSGITLAIVGDIFHLPQNVQVYSNIVLFPYGWKDLVRRFEQISEIKAPLLYNVTNKQEKTNDFKPMIGEMFPNLVKPYGYWGYIDYMIFGDFNSFFSTSLLRHFSIIYPTPEKLNFHKSFTLFKNHPHTNELWHLIPQTMLHRVATTNSSVNVVPNGMNQAFDRWKLVADEAKISAGNRGGFPFTNINLDKASCERIHEEGESKLVLVDDSIKKDQEYAFCIIDW